MVSNKRQFFSFLNTSAFFFTFSLTQNTDSLLFHACCKTSHAETEWVNKIHLIVRKSRTETAQILTAKFTNCQDCEKRCSNPVLVVICSRFPKGTCNQRHHVTVLLHPFSSDRQINAAMLNFDAPFLPFSHLVMVLCHNKKTLAMLPLWSGRHSPLICHNC